jgi:nudix-type nucleoside diphosphatase (YffH/AdpP family)
MTELPERVRVLEVEEVARTGFSVLRRTRMAYRRSDGAWQTFWRETYDRGNGAAILLYDPSRDCVLLVRQFRFPVFANPKPDAAAETRGWLIEVPAGLLDDHVAAGRSVEEAIRREAEEEAGVRVADPRRLMDTYMSPGSITERVALFVATYAPSDRTGAGGGLAAEGEDIQILEPTLAEAAAMIARGEIADAKTVILIYWALLHGADLVGAPR